MNNIYFVEKPPAEIPPIVAPPKDSVEQSAVNPSRYKQTSIILPTKASNAEAGGNIGEELPDASEFDAEAPARLPPPPS